jgi:hypothetical protein
MRSGHLLRSWHAPVLVVVVVECELMPVMSSDHHLSI